MDELTRPNKRPRTETEHSHPEPVGTSPDAPSTHRDTEYYWEDGNCILLVESTLFKVRHPFTRGILRGDTTSSHQVHRSLFVRDSAVFRDMLSLGDVNQVCTEGSDDSTPIILQDTSEDFRTLCWAIYAL
jgi:hypothetical protein